MSHQTHSVAEFLKIKSKELGFHDIGFTRPQIDPNDIRDYLQWLEMGYQASMTYMENTLRCFPTQLLEGAQTAVVLITNYKQPLQKTLPPLQGKIARYAQGKDYHNILKKRLQKLVIALEEFVGTPITTKLFTDSVPILEKALAVQAGLGWQGKNTLLIHRQFGTFFFISGFLTTLNISFEPPKLYGRTPRCGTCTLCLDKCPTQALEQPYLLNAFKCLSYQSIESENPIPIHLQKKNPGYIFGCDICQEVCPHNVKPPFIEKESPFHSSQGVGSTLSLTQLESTFSSKEAFFGTPLKRQSVQILKENLLSLNREFNDPSH